MATSSSSTVLDQTSDAAFRAWIAEYISFVDVGGNLVDTGDTGQINTSTVNRPAGTSTNAGFITRRFNDSLQSTAPYFFRWDFGSGASSNATPRIQLTIGTGTNGSGVITGVLQAAFGISQGNDASSVSVALQSFACSHPGSLGIAFKCNHNTTHGGFSYLGLHRIRSIAGDQTTDGLVVVTPRSAQNAAATASMRSYRRVSPASFGGDQVNSFCLIPLLTTTSVQPGGNVLAYRHFTAIPEQRPLLESVTVIQSEVGLGTTFSARPVGSTDRTYVALGNILRSPAAGVGTGTDYSIAMLYD